MFELSQLGSVGLNETNLLYIHRDPISYNKNVKIQKIVDELVSALHSKLFFFYFIKIKTNKS